MKKILFALLLLVVSQGAFAQKTINGRVINAESGLGMAGVTILVKGAKTGTVTNPNGNFTMNVPNDAIIAVSFVGFKSVEIPVGNQTRFEISLQPDAKSNETVVTALGITRETKEVPLIVDGRPVRGILIDSMGIVRELWTTTEELATRELQREQMRQAMEKAIERGEEFLRRTQIIAAPNILRAEGHTLWADNFSISRTLNDNSHTEEHSFNLDKTAKSMILSVVGNCTAGEIRIKILTPNGQVYSETIIDAQGNMNWRRTITISETENQDKIGDWKCQVSTNNATGNYRIAVQVN